MINECVIGELCPYPNTETFVNDGIRRSKKLDRGSDGSEVKRIRCVVVWRSNDMSRGKQAER